MPGPLLEEDIQIPINRVMSFAFPQTGKTQGLSHKIEFGIREQINGGYMIMRGPHINLLKIAKPGLNV